MKQLSSIIKVIGVVTKYVAIAVAFSKALQVFHEELKKIEPTEPKTQEDANE